MEGRCAEREMTEMLKEAHQEHNKDEAMDGAATMTLEMAEGEDAAEASSRETSRHAEDKVTLFHRYIYQYLVNRGYHRTAAHYAADLVPAKRRNLAAPVDSATGFLFEWWMVSYSIIEGLHRPETWPIRPRSEHQRQTDHESKINAAGWTTLPSQPGPFAQVFERAAIYDGCSDGAALAPSQQLYLPQPNAYRESTDPSIDDWSSFESADYTRRMHHASNRDAQQWQAVLFALTAQAQRSAGYEGPFPPDSGHGHNHALSMSPWQPDAPPTETDVIFLNWQESRRNPNGTIRVDGQPPSTSVPSSAPMAAQGVKGFQQPMSSDMQSLSAPAPSQEFPWGASTVRTKTPVDQQQQQHLGVGRGYLDFDTPADTSGAEASAASQTTSTIARKSGKAGAAAACKAKTPRRIKVTRKSAVLSDSSEAPKSRGRTKKQSSSGGAVQGKKTSPTKTKEDVDEMETATDTKSVLDEPTTADVFTSNSAANDTTRPYHGLTDTDFDELAADAAAAVATSYPPPAVSGQSAMDTGGWSTTRQPSAFEAYGADASGDDQDLHMEQVLADCVREWMGGPPSGQQVDSGSSAQAAASSPSFVEMPRFKAEPDFIRFVNDTGRTGLHCGANAAQTQTHHFPLPSMYFEDSGDVNGVQMHTFRQCEATSMEDFKSVLDTSAASHMNSAMMSPPTSSASMTTLAGWQRGDTTPKTAREATDDMDIYAGQQVQEAVIAQFMEKYRGRVD